MARSLAKTIKGFLRTTSGRHSESPGQNVTSQMPHPEAPADRPHIREDAMKEVNLRYEMGKSLEKGEHGDWQKEGYKISHEIDGHGIKRVHAHAPDGRLAGEVEFWDDVPGHAGKIYVGLVNVDEKHRRKGLATAMYLHGERVFGSKVQPSISQSRDARALWSQPNRPFGKSEPLDKVVVSDFYGEVDHPWEEYAHRQLPLIATLKHGGRNVFVRKGHRHTAYVITHNDAPNGAAISVLHVKQGYDGAGTTDPYISWRETREDHKGRGLNTILSEAAVKHQGRLRSDIRVSPATEHIWRNKMAQNPKINVKYAETVSGNHPMSLTGNYNDQHIATWKVRKSEAHSLDAETALIAKNKLTKEAQAPHKFQAAHWTHPNGHPRCILCGDEEPVGGVCDGVDLKKSIEAMAKDLVFESSDEEPYREVWRIQNKRGQGPYKGQSSEWQKETHSGDTGRPTPLEDNFSAADHDALHAFGSKFGFENEDQMYRWFHPEELQALGRLGFAPVKVKASRIWSSGNQIFFEPHLEDRQSLNKVVVSPNYGENYQDWHDDHNAPGTKYVKTKEYKGHKIHVHDTFDEEMPHLSRTSYTITENGEPHAPAIATLHVSEHHPEYGHMKHPYVSWRATEAKHEGKGLSTVLTEAVLQDIGKLQSDNRVSPATEHIWRHKLADNPNIKVKHAESISGSHPMSITGKYDDAHVASWVNKPKPAKAAPVPAKKVKKSEDLDKAGRINTDRQHTAEYSGPAPKMSKSSNIWALKIRGRDGTFKAHSMTSLGPTKGTAYVLDSGEVIPADQCEGVVMFDAVDRVGPNGNTADTSFHLAKSYNGWHIPSDQDLSNEYDREYRHVKSWVGDIFPTKEHFLAAAKAGRLEDMPSDVERATDVPDVRGVQSMVSHYQYPRDVNRIVEGLKTNSPMPAPIVIRHSGGHFMMGGNTRQNLARIHGSHPKVLIVNAPGESLDKGAARRLAPFSPPHGETEETKRAKKWVRDSKAGEREELPRHDGEIRFRGLNRIFAETKHRRNPATGDIEVLLHRGMSPGEVPGHKTGEIINKTSWTTNLKEASTLANDYNDDEEVGQVMSAWIPIHHLHHFVFMHGHDPTIKSFRSESEVIVNPHSKGNNIERVVPHYAALGAALLHRYPGEKIIDTFNYMMHIKGILPAGKHKDIIRQQVKANLGEGIKIPRDRDAPVTPDFTIKKSLAAILSKSINSQNIMDLVGKNPNVNSRMQIPDIRTDGRVFVSMDGDNIGASVERAAMKDDLKTIVEQTQLIMAGQRLIREWAKNRGADIYIDGGDDIAFTMPTETVPELDDLRQLYSARTGYTVTIGVGDSISRAGHAMLYGKLHGKNQVNQWTPELAQTLAQISKKLSPEEKLMEHGLLKARQAARETLEKGAKGDWQKEGYKLKHEKTPGGDHVVTAFTRDGHKAGRYHFMSDGDQQGNPFLSPLSVSTAAAHRRKGLATAAYDLAEHKSKLEMLPSAVQSNDAKLFWTARLGKSTPIGVASVAVIDPDTKCILMGQRQDSGKWTLPGGHLNPGENALTGAMRELREEAGVICRALKYLGSETKICEDGVERTIHAYVMYGRPKTTGEYDPDEEVRQWLWIPFTNGLPDAVSKNLQAPKNVTLKLLRLQSW